MDISDTERHEEAALDIASAQLIATIGIFIGIVALLFAVFGLMWQMNSQSNRLEAKIEAQREDMNSQGKDLEAKIDARGEDITEQGKELEAKIDAQGRELEAQIDAQGRELRAEIIAQGQRVSDSELEQARLNGVNSVLTRLVHTHEVQAGDD